MSTWGCASSVVIGNAGRITGDSGQVALPIGRDLLVAAMGG
jgi:hypothetical protein